MQLFTKIWKAGITTEPIAPADLEAVAIGRQLDQWIKKLFGRSLAIREVDAGSCNGCEVEITGLTSPVYDMERFGLHFVASPRHADMLLVTGPVTRNMEIPLRKTYEATPDPKFVVAVGDCAHTCGVFKGSYAVVGPVSSVIPVDVVVTGCPPEPADLLRGILEAIGRFVQKRERGR
jgi:Ni,Fe-hydrogenase III small subunit